MPVSHYFEITLHLASAWVAGSLIGLAENAFNYQLHGRRGFDRLADVVAACHCADVVYSDLPRAAAALCDLWASPAG